MRREGARVALLLVLSFGATRQQKSADAQGRQPISDLAWFVAASGPPTPRRWAQACNASRPVTSGQTISPKKLLTGGSHSPAASTCDSAEDAVRDFRFVSAHGFSR